MTKCVHISKYTWLPLSHDLQKHIAELMKSNYLAIYIFIFHLFIFFNPHVVFWSFWHNEDSFS